MKRTQDSAGTHHTRQQPGPWLAANGTTPVTPHRIPAQLEAVVQISPAPLAQQPPRQPLRLMTQAMGVGVPLLER